jgi:hypothetical protein
VALYDKVDTCSGSGWYILILEAYSFKANEFDIVYSINPSKKQWCYGCPDNTIPKQFLVDKCHVVKAWSRLCHALTNGYGRNLDEPNIKKEEFDQLKGYLKEVKPVNTKNQEDWVKIRVWEFRWSNHLFDIWVDKTNLTYVMGDKLGDDKDTKIKKELHAIRMGNGRISEETHNYIMSNFKKVSRDDIIGRKWYRVYAAGADSKFGRYMVSLDTRERRNQTMDEFYDGGIVD